MTATWALPITHITRHAIANGRSPTNLNPILPKWQSLSEVLGLRFPVDVTPYSLVEIWQRFEGICWFHFQGTAVPSRGTLLFRIRVSAGVGDELASCTVLLTHAVCAGATHVNSASGHAYFSVFRYRWGGRAQAGVRFLRSRNNACDIPEHGSCHGMSRQMQAFYAIKLRARGHDKWNTLYHSSKSNDYATC